MSKADRGFRTLWRNDPVRARQIASKGGKASHKIGTGHEFTSEEAKLAGKKSGELRRKRLKGEGFDTR